MIGKLAKLMAYAKAPRQAFTVLHPFRAAKFGAAYWLGKKLFGRKRPS